MFIQCTSKHIEAESSASSASDAFCDFCVNVVYGLTIFLLYFLFKCLAFLLFFYRRSIQIIQTIFLQTDTVSEMRMTLATVLH